MHTLLENCLKLFGDSVYIKHVPVLQQEGTQLAQRSLVLLIAASFGTKSSSLCRLCSTESANVSHHDGKIILSC